MSGYKGWAGGEKVDWDKVDSGSPTPLERGIYNAVVTKVEAQTTKNNKPSLAVELEVDGKYKSDEEVKRKLFDTFTMTSEGLFKAKQFCEATDIDPPESTTFGDVEEFAGEMLNAEVYVLVGTRTFEGKLRNRIEFYISDSTVEEVYARESGDSPRAAAGVKGRRRRGGGGDAQEEQPSKSRRRRAEVANANGKGSEDVEDVEGAEVGEEEQPRRARRRRRAQAEQG